jgi:hypothetical protein
MMVKLNGTWFIMIGSELRMDNLTRKKEVKRSTTWYINLQGNSVEILIESELIFICNNNNK